MFTPNITVTGHYLSLCEVLVVSVFLLSEVNFLGLVFCCGGPLTMVGFTCALEWLDAIWVAIADPGIVLYCLFSIEVLSLGSISLSSESLSESTYFDCLALCPFAIRLLLIMCTEIEGMKSCFNVLFSLYMFSSQVEYRCLWCVEHP